MRSAAKVCSIAFLWVVTAMSAPAPQFSLTDLSGKAVSLASLKGNVVVIDFWATWCHACKDAFAHLNAIQKEYEGKNLVVLGVNLEKIKPEKIAAFAKKAGIEYTILPDAESSLAKLYGIKGVPSLTVIDKNQELVKTFRGLNSSTEKEISALLQKLTASK